MDLLYVLELLCTLDVPDAPSRPVVTSVTSDSVTLDWHVPSFDGGAPISGYIIEKKETSSTYWSRVSTVSSGVTSHHITRLHRGEEYEFRVSAENRAGVGPASAPSAPIRAEDATGMKNFIIQRQL